MLHFAQGGNHASQARYLFTKLNPLARAFFPPTDDELLSYREDDGQSVEPYWYVEGVEGVCGHGGRGRYSKSAGTPHAGHPLNQ